MPPTFRVEAPGTVRGGLALRPGRPRDRLLRGAVGLLLPPVLGRATWAPSAVCRSWTLARTTGPSP
eukprot:8690190-Alexandrium_andersonii.AAC.1